MKSSLDDKDQIMLFLARAEQLRQCRIIQNNFPLTFSLKYDRLKGLAVSFTQPDEENFRSFLPLLRQFISPREPVFLFHIYNLCMQHFTNDQFKHWLQDARNKWKAQLKSDGISLVINGKEHTPEEITDCWLHGEYFHSDEKKRQFLMSLVAEPIAFFLTREKFMNHCMQAARQVLYVYSLAKASIHEGMFV